MEANDPEIDKEIGKIYIEHENRMNNFYRSHVGKGIDSKTFFNFDTNSLHNCHERAGNLLITFCESSSFEHCNSFHHESVINSLQSSNCTNEMVKLVESDPNSSDGALKAAMNEKTINNNTSKGDCNSDTSQSSNIMSNKRKEFDTTHDVYTTEIPYKSKKYPEGQKIKTEEVSITTISSYKIHHQ
jgi:hypothetical protein